MFCGNGWYFRARKKVLTDFISAAISTGSRILDVGCGDGWLKGVLPGCHVFGVEADEELRQMAQLRDMTVFREIPYIVSKMERYDSVTCFDVLEHLPDEDKALRNMKHILKPGGSIFVSVPLYPKIWSIHDENAHHYKRYKKGEVIALLKKHNFIIIRKRYFLSSPLVLIYIARKLFPERETGMQVSGFFDKLLYWGAVIDSKMNLPFGLTEIVEAKSM